MIAHTWDVQLDLGWQSAQPSSQDLKEITKEKEQLEETSKINQKILNGAKSKDFQAKALSIIFFVGCILAGALIGTIVAGPLGTLAGAAMGAGIGIGPTPFIYLKAQTYLSKKQTLALSLEEIKPYISEARSKINLGQTVDRPPENVISALHTIKMQKNTSNKETIGFIESYLEKEDANFLINTLIPISISRNWI